jgi:hypothetical protein
VRSEVEREEAMRMLHHLNRRTFAKLAGAAGLIYAVPSLAADQEARGAVPLFDGKTLTGWIQLENKPDMAAGWTVKDGAIASTGSGRGVIYTVGDYGRFRLMFTMRHVSGSPDHQACVLIFCTRPKPGEKALDALGGIQLQVPKGGHWDYRPGKNTDGGAEFTTVIKPRFDPHEWSRVEILADAASGTAQMAVAQPAGSKAVEILDFKDPTAGQSGPIALQMHNAGLFDEYKNISVEVNPTVDRLIMAG